MQNSLFIGDIVATLSITVGTCNAFLFERREFPGKRALYILMIIALVIPGVILGISILVFASIIANGVDAAFGIDIGFLRPEIGRASCRARVGQYVSISVCAVHFKNKIHSEPYNLIYDIYRLFI